MYVSYFGDSLYATLLLSYQSWKALNETYSGAKYFKAQSFCPPAGALCQCTSTMHKYAAGRILSMKPTTPERVSCPVHNCWARRSSQPALGGLRNADQNGPEPDQPVRVGRHRLPDRRAHRPGEVVAVLRARPAFRIPYKFHKRPTDKPTFYSIRSQQRSSSSCSSMSRNCWFS